jgi:hypothetical protein
VRTPSLISSLPSSQQASVGEHVLAFTLKPSFVNAVVFLSGLILQWCLPICVDLAVAFHQINKDGKKQKGLLFVPPCL